MEFLKKLSLRNKVNIFIYVSFLLLFFAISIIVSIKNVDSENDSSELKAKNQSGILLELIDRNLFERNGDVKAFASNPLVAEILNNTKLVDENNSLAKGFQEQLNKLTAYYECYDLMMICDMYGNVLYTNTKDRKGTDVNFSEIKSENFVNENWFKQAIKSKSENFESDITQNSSIAKACNNSGLGIEYSFAILNEYGDIVGVWYNFFNFNYVVDVMLEDLEKELQISNNLASYILLINKNGQVISSTHKNVREHKLIINLEEFNKGNALSSDFTLLFNNYILQKGIHKSDRYENSWDAIALVPKDKVGVSTFLDSYTLGFLVLVIIFLIISNRLIKLIVDRILNVKKQLQEVTIGNLLEIDEIKDDSNDEIKEMQLALFDLSNALKEKQEFANAIGTGDFTVNFDLKYENDNLGKSLIEMKNNLLSVSLNDKKQNWITQGLAHFVEILRTNSDDRSILYDRIIQNLVKYVKANQGGLFVISKNNEEKDFFELVTCYAWDRKKYLNMRIEKGEGLVGQCWIEGEKILLTEVPDNFVRITSGLGFANPRSILIMPLKLNDEIFGAIELASFNYFEEHEIKFIEKLSESIASTISSEQINEHTKFLLNESKKQQLEMETQTEELRAQEEEMRQNIEELQTTQEEMENAQNAMVEAIELTKQKEREILQIKEDLEREFKAQSEIINMFAIVSKTDLKGNITYANDEFLKWSKYSREELIGQNHRILKSGDQDDQIFIDMWKTISSGKIFRGEVKNKAKDGSFYWVDAIIAPVLGESGKPVEYIAQRFVINEKKELESKLAELEKKNR